MSLFWYVLLLFVVCFIFGWILSGIDLKNKKAKAEKELIEVREELEKHKKEHNELKLIQRKRRREEKVSDLL